MLTIEDVLHVTYKLHEMITCLKLTDLLVTMQNIDNAK